MKLNRSHIVYVPHNGSGKMRTFEIHPSLVRIFSFIVILCVCAVPFLESGIFSLSARLVDLEQNRRELNSEILTLGYIKKALARIEAKEVRLREHFGIEKFNSLNQIIGGGVELNSAGSEAVYRQSRREADAYHSIAPNMNLPDKLKLVNLNYEIFSNLLIKQAETWETTPSIVPVQLENSRISSGFGWRKNPFTEKSEFHAGIDIVGPVGTKVVAPAFGVVAAMGYDRWLGNYLVLQHTEEIRTIYGHLRKVSVKEGAQVKRGGQVGIMGNTGMSTSHHLHYAVIVKGRAVDPLQFILGVNAGSS